MTTEKGTQEDRATVLPVSCLRDTVLSRHLIQTALAVPLSPFPLPSRTFYIFPFHLLHFFKTIFIRCVGTLDTHCVCGQDNFASVFPLRRFWGLNPGLQA